MDEGERVRPTPNNIPKKKAIDNEGSKNEPAQTHCRRGQACTVENCRFLHPTATKPCRNGPSCTVKGCRFVHRTDKSVGSNKGGHEEKGTQSQTAAKKKNRRGKNTTATVLPPATDETAVTIPTTPPTDREPRAATAVDAAPVANAGAKPQQKTDKGKRQRKGAKAAETTRPTGSPAVAASVPEAAPKPAATKPAATKAAATKPVTTKPAATKPAAVKPAKAKSSKATATKSSPSSTLTSMVKPRVEEPPATATTEAEPTQTTLPSMVKPRKSAGTAKAPEPKPATLNNTLPKNKPCRNGANCQKVGCAFRHPPATTTPVPQAPRPKWKPPPFRTQPPPPQPQMHLPPPPQDDEDEEDLGPLFVWVGDIEGDQGLPPAELEFTMSAMVENLVEEDTRKDLEPVSPVVSTTPPTKHAPAVVSPPAVSQVTTETKPARKKKTRNRKTKDPVKAAPAAPAIRAEELMARMDSMDPEEIKQALASMTDEERERYKAMRNAAKKERRRQEQQAKQPDPNEEPSKEPAAQPNDDADVDEEEDEDDANGNTENVHPDPAEANSSMTNPEEMKRRIQEELERQEERAAEKKEQKKKARHERYLQEQLRMSQLNEARAEFWRAEIQKEKDATGLMVDLVLAEFCRNYPGELDRKMLKEDLAIATRVASACLPAYRELYKSVIPTRVTVKGLPNQHDWNDRTGTIEYWDESKGKYFVSLDTKKRKGSQGVHLAPDNLEALPVEASKRKRTPNPAAVIHLQGLYHRVNCRVDVYRSDVDGIMSARFKDTYIDNLMKQRDEEERLAKEYEEELRRQEEEARKRREERRRREEEEYEARREQARQAKKEYAEYRRQYRAANRSSPFGSASFRGGGFAGGHSGCGCPTCQINRMRASGFFMPGFGFFGGFGGGFYPEEADYDDDYDDEQYYYYNGDGDDDDEDWDERWEGMEREQQNSRKQQAAEVLGVSVDATEADVKRVYRRQVLIYHPDRFRPEDHEGMTKQEAEDYVKEINDAYDVLMSSFD